MRIKNTLILIAMFSLWACKHDNIENLLGPDLKTSGLLCAAPNFSIQDPENGPSNVDFALTNLSFEAQMSEELGWNYGLKGTNGAEYVAKGDGKKIVVNWDGSTDNNIFFNSGDSVRLFYLVNCLDTLWYNKKILLKGKKNLKDFLLADFDGAGAIPNWNNASGDLDSLNLAKTGGAPQKSKFMRLVSKVTKTGSYKGQASIPSKNLDQVLGLSAAPDQLYINALVKGTPNAIVEFRVYEKDGDFYFSQVPVTWVGWRLISLPYSKFTDSINKFGKDTKQINEFRLALRGTDNNVVRADLDYITFTQNSPLDL
jgi:hypothetical protein